MNELVAEAFAAFAADGGSDGYITVADNTIFYPGAFAWIVSSLVAARRVQVTNLSGATKVGVRFYGDSASGATAGTSPSYGRSDVSAYKLADSATLNQEAQAVRVVQPLFGKVSSR